MVLACEENCLVTITSTEDGYENISVSATFQKHPESRVVFPKQLEDESGIKVFVYSIMICGLCNDIIQDPQWWEFFVFSFCLPECGHAFCGYCIRKELRKRWSEGRYHPMSCSVCNREISQDAMLSSASTLEDLIQIFIRNNVLPDIVYDPRTIQGKIVDSFIIIESEDSMQ
ncbi:hypothetical protein M422DRAFT_44421 [Sphaerobolus stellatus SS14]|nr:hypothetical protein M422DRAFT_44421 [Sphaerobolus stellatus SS14]